MRNKFMVFTVIALFLITCITAYAEDHEIAPYASDMINSCSVQLSGNGSVLTATAKITAKAVYDQVGFSTLKFQKYSSGSWVTVKTISSVYKYETSTYRGLHTCTGTTGEKYRAVCTFYVRNGTSSDSYTHTSSTFTL